MTRLLIVWPLVVALGLLAAPTRAQTASPPAPSRYAPQQAQPQARAGQSPVAQGPVAQGPAVQGPVRQALNDTIRQPGGPQKASAGAPQPGPANGPPDAIPVAPLSPSWFPLEAAHQKWVDEILSFWEQESGKVKTFECKFQRWEYDPVFGPHNEAKTFAEGVINYAQPDKGLYRVEKLSSFAPPAKPGDKPQYFEQDATFGEHWVCDGKKIFSFDARNKQLKVQPLPPEMQGKAIVDGPLPFLFGAKAQTIKARYWIRGLPESGEGKYWLEAVPKGRQDAQNFKMIHIVLDGNTFLPEMLQLFAPNFDEKTNPARTTHVFKEIKTGDAKFWGVLPVRNITEWVNGRFYEPKLPAGWKRVIESDVSGAASASLDAPGPAAPRPRPASPLPR